MNICFIYGVSFHPSLLQELGSTEWEEGIMHSRKKLKDADLVNSRKCIHVHNMLLTKGVK